LFSAINLYILPRRLHACTGLHTCQAAPLSHQVLLQPGTKQFAFSASTSRIIGQIQGANLLKLITASKKTNILIWLANQPNSKQ
jgi:hypothetical protein